MPLLDMIPGPNYTQRFSQVEETPLTPSCDVPGLSPFVLFCFFPWFNTYFSGFS